LGNNYIIILINEAYLKRIICNIKIKKILSLILICNIKNKIIKINKCTLIIIFIKDIIKKKLVIALLDIKVYIIKDLKVKDKYIKTLEFDYQF